MVVLKTLSQSWCLSSFKTLSGVMGQGFVIGKIDEERISVDIRADQGHLCPGSAWVLFQGHKAGGEETEGE